MSTPAKIKKLDEVVVNRIAAGEVIQRPANALKELIENSLDAKSTNIQITVKDGGLKSLQIQDNGTGIRKEDMEIVCERFTTSKLQKFEDLKTISTFGFRGEALASISHVAHLTITTKTSLSNVAYKASYTDGKLKNDIKSIAGNQGTTILIENLFYNVVTRRKALASPAEELTKISEVVTRYAIHNPHVGFTLKKQGEVIPVVRTPHNSTKTNNIKLLYGNQVARELLDIELDNITYKLKMQSLITNPNYSSKRMTLLLFINHRLVDSTPIKKMLEDLYSIYLPKKTHPWCYISLEIDPNIVDVNVHPTKHEVRFLHEDTIIEIVKGALDEKLSTNTSSRTFYVQARLPQVVITKEDLEEVLPEYSKDKNKDDKKLYAKNMIRTDANDQKLDKFNFTINAKHDESIADKTNDESIVDKINDESIVDKISDESLNNNFQLTCPSDALTTPEPTRSNERKNPQGNWTKILDDSSSQSSNSTNAPTDPPITVEILKPNDKQNEDIIPDDSFVLMDSDDEPPQDNSKSNVVDPAMKTVVPHIELQEKPQADDETNENINNKNTKSIEKAKEKEKNVNVSSPDNNQVDESIKSNDKIEPSQLSEFKSYSINNFRRPVKLTTVLQLRKDVEDNYHEGLKKILSEMSFIGCVKNDLVLFQSDVNLYICKTRILAEELFYEIMLYDFANYGVLKFSDPLSLTDLAMLGLSTEEVGWTEDDGPKEEIAQRVTNLLIEKAPMLKEYFSIVIDSKGYLKSLPVLLDKYLPCPGDLPVYILRLSTEVNWTTEKECFDGICRETAKFFSHVDYSNEQYDSKHMIEHVLYPAIKESLLPPKHFSHDSTILQVASLPNLYKVFERC